MASNTESIVIGDIVKLEADGYHCREERTTKDGQVISIGEVCRLLASDSKMYACGAAVDEVQTITPNVETGVDEVQTITPAVGSNADAVQTITVGGTSSGGTLKLGFRPLDDPGGPILWTDTIAWNGTEATMTTSVNTALDNLLGSTEVVCGTIADTASLVMVLTFSGTNATNRPHGLVSVDVSALTGASTVGVVMTTPGSGLINGGNYRLGVYDVAGDLNWTYPLAHDANAAAIETALTDALGAVNGINVTGGPMNGPTAIVLTYDAEATFANRPFGLVVADVNDLFGLDDLSIVRTTIGEGETGGGYWRIGLINAAGVFLWTEGIAHDADATAISLAITNAIGSALVVATGGPLGGASPAAVVLTWSGAAYTELPQEMVQVDVSDIEGLAHVTLVETTSGHTAGGDATAVALTASSPSGADGTAIFIFQGPCTLDADAMTYPTGGQANAVAALKALGIRALSEPTLTEVLT